MTRATVATTGPAFPALSTGVMTPAYQAYEILHVGFAVLPLVAGLASLFTSSVLEVGKAI